MTKDLIQVADTDFRNVNITSIAAVFFIIAIVFRSASIPVLLVGIIESAIMINMGIPYFSGAVLPFVASHRGRNHSTGSNGRLCDFDDNPIP